MQPPNQPRQLEARTFVPRQPTELHHRWIILMVHNEQMPVLFTPGAAPNICHLHSADGSLDGDFDVSTYMGVSLQEVPAPVIAQSAEAPRDDLTILTRVDPATLRDYQGMLNRAIRRDKQGDPPTQP